MTKNISLDQYKMVEAEFYASNPSATNEQCHQYMMTYMNDLEDQYYKELYDTEEASSSQEAEEE